jgi:hypothetical protein
MRLAVTARENCARNSIARAIYYCAEKQDLRHLICPDRANNLPHAPQFALFATQTLGRGVVQLL